MGVFRGKAGPGGNEKGDVVVEFDVHELTANPKYEYGANTKYEYRNTKQIQNYNVRNSKLKTAACRLREPLRGKAGPGGNEKGDVVVEFDVHELTANTKYEYGANPKYEYRNTKQIQNYNVRNSKLKTAACRLREPLRGKAGPGGNEKGDVVVEFDVHELTANPKYEYRNTKQIQNYNVRNSKLKTAACRLRGFTVKAFLFYHEGHEGQIGQQFWVLGFGFWLIEIWVYHEGHEGHEGLLSITHPKHSSAPWVPQRI